VWTRNGIDSSTINWTSGSNAVVLPDNSVTFLTVTGATPVKPQTGTGAGGVSLWRGPVTVGVYSASGRRLATFVANVRGESSVNAIARNAQRALPRGLETGLYFLVLKTDTEQMKLGPFVSNATKMK
jgi:hypothetical protein